MGTLLALLAHLSTFGLSLGTGGLVILVGALLCLSILPAFVVRPAIAIGASLTVAGLLYSVGYGRGTSAEQARGVELAATAERARAERAEAISRETVDAATRDLADSAARERALQDLVHDLRTAPDRDRACVPRDLARRLRDL